MIVRWNSGEKGRNGLPGRKQNINYHFEYAGKRRIIPTVYRFPQGIIFDILTVLEDTELRAFYEKYQDVEEVLSPAQRRAMEYEHPYQSVSFGKIEINGKLPPCGWSSAGGLHIPWIMEHQRFEREAKAYKQYLGEASCFACVRYTIPLSADPPPIWKRLRYWLFPTEITRLELEICETFRFFPIELSFTLPRDFSGVHTETFLHPQTKTPHKLHFQGIQHEEVQIPTDRSVKSLYTTQLSYEIEPALQESSRLQFCSSIQWEQGPVEPDGFSPHSAGSIGIIGGADGPTSILMATRDGSSPSIPRGIHDLPLYYCFAKPSAKPEPTISVVLEGVNVKWRDSETNLFI